MSAGRRGLILSVTFLALALWVCPAKRAAAQQPGPWGTNTGKHHIWKQNLSPEQIRDLLAKYGQNDGKTDPFEEMLRKAIEDRNPDANKEQIDALTKRFMNDKEFRDRVIDLAQRQKNLMKDKGNGNNPPLEFNERDRAKLEELAKQLKLQPNPKDGDPFKVPDGPINPNDLPPFDPKNPQFDPMRFPGIDPQNPPKFDPKTKFPLDPDTGKPFDPRDRQRPPIDPANPPKIEPPPPKIDQPPPKVDQPPPPPKFDPKTGKPVNPPDDGKRRFDPDNPLGKAEESPEKQAKNKALEAATALWEKNVGPIDDSPAVKRALIDLVSDPDMMDALTDSKGRNFFDAINDNGDNDKFGGLFGDGDSGWEWPKLDLDWGRGKGLDWDLGGGRRREPPDWSRDPPSSSSSSSGGSDLGSLDLGGMKVPWLVLLILIALVAGTLVWWKWGSMIRAPLAAAGPTGPLPWPIDPRDINTREDVVKAFEYLSVLICGPDAKTWTHSTIADELTKLAETHGEAAVKLARLYELARYAPLDEPLSRTELLEARRLVCDLAGMDEV